MLARFERILPEGQVESAGSRLLRIDVLTATDGLPVVGVAVALRVAEIDFGMTPAAGKGAQIDVATALARTLIDGRGSA